MRISTIAAMGVAAALAARALPARADEIVDISVEDNKKTTADTVKLIADIDVGDDWIPEMADQITRRLVTSGLFKDVKVYSEPAAGGVLVHLIVKDKHSWVIAPALYDQPTNKGGGVGFGENNLFGRDQKLLLYGQIATGDSFFVGAFVDPSLFDTRFRAQFDVYLATNKIIEYAPPTAWRSNPLPVRTSRLHYLNEGMKLGSRLWGKSYFDVRLRAAHVGYADVQLASGATLDQVTNDPNATEPPPPGISGWDISSQAFFTIDTRANWYGLSAGHKIVAMYEQSLPSVGSAFRYWDASLYGESATRVLDAHDLVLKGSIAFGHDLPFQQELTAGGTMMRGWKNMQLRGDFQVNANAEYSVPVFTIQGFSVRGIGFWDSTYTTFLNSQTDDTFRNYLPNDEPRGLAPFKNSVGVGTRLYLRQIVLPLLGLDFGYGVERGDYEIYLAIGLTD